MKIIFNIKFYYSLNFNLKITAMPISPFVYTFNPYVYEYEKLVLDFENKYSNKMDIYNIMERIMECEPLPNEFYKIKHKTKTISTTNGIRTLPHIIAVIIMFYRENHLKYLFDKAQFTISQNTNSSEFKNYYEPRAMKKRTKFNKIIDYYVEEYANKSKK